MGEPGGARAGSSAQAESIRHEIETVAIMFDGELGDLLADAGAS